jgi:hypothetical protein
MILSGFEDLGFIREGSGGEGGRIREEVLDLIIRYITRLVHILLHYNLHDSLLGFEV